MTLEFHFDMLVLLMKSGVRNVSVALYLVRYCRWWLVNGFHVHVGRRTRHYSGYILFFLYIQSFNDVTGVDWRHNFCYLNN